MVDKHVSFFVVVLNNKQINNKKWLVFAKYKNVNEHCISFPRRCESVFSVVGQQINKC